MIARKRGNITTEQNIKAAPTDKNPNKASKPIFPWTQAIPGIAIPVSEKVNIYLIAKTRLRQSFRATRPTKTSLIGT